jgi:hypothetical protein
MMISDAPPRKANQRTGFLESDRIKTLDLPQGGSLLTIAKSIESAMKDGRSTDVRRACAEFLDAASEFYRVPACGLRVLAARPLRVRENWHCVRFLSGVVVSQSSQTSTTPPSFLGGAPDS